MFGSPVADDGSAVIVPLSGEGDDGGWGGTDEVVLQFPVEIEIRLVAAHDPEQLVGVVLDRLTAALQGLA
jgi:hypothetical protein